MPQGFPADLARPRHCANGETACLESSKGRKKKKKNGNGFVIRCNYSAVPQTAVLREFTKILVPPSFAFDYCLLVSWVVTHVHTYVCTRGTCWNFIIVITWTRCKHIYVNSCFFFCVVAGYFVQRFYANTFVHIHNGKCETSTGWKFVSVVKYKQRVLCLLSAFTCLTCVTRVLWISVSA